MFTRRISLALMSIMIIVALVITAGCGGGADKAKTEAVRGLTVKVLDVGQGDAILIRTAGQVTLIDTGDVPAKDKLVAYIKGQGITVIDNLIITHPHADHLGGAMAVLDNFTVKRIYDSGQTASSAMYRNYLAAVQKKKIPFAVLKAGDKLDLGDGAALKVLAPEEPFITGTESDLNNNSIVARLTYGDFSMLLTGDAEQEAEGRMLKRFSGELQSQVIKVGHHGSHSSSSPAFLNAVRPETAIVSLGAGNDYHHPHPSTVRRYNEQKIKLYRTDIDGTVTITTSGKGYQVSKEK